jgi:prophage maintenance system killer protein
MIKTNLLTIKNNEKSSLFIYAAMFVDKNNQFYKKDEELFKIAVKNSINAGKMSYFNNQYCVIGRNNMKIPCSIDKHKINVLSESHYLFLRNRLIKIIKLTHKFIQAIPDSNGIIGGHFGLSNSHSTNEETIIDSILLRMMHNANSCNVLELASQILFKINANHIYNNGNKRTALISTFSILH